MTVTGPVRSDDLGLVLVHEHIRVLLQGAELDPKRGLDREAQVSTAVSKLRELYDLGVRTFVDPSPIELGRDVTLLREVSERSGMQIVCATGFYHETNGFGLPHYWRQRWAEEIAELYVDELQNGVGDTGIRPGVIKVATGAKVSPAEQRCLTAAGIASLATGAPIITHTTAGGGVDEQLAAFEAAQVDPGSCLIGHQDDQNDYTKLTDIVKRGHFVGFDRIGYTRMIGDDHRADQIIRLAEAGYLDRVCLSMDHWCVDPHPRNLFWVDPAEAEAFDRDVRPERDFQMVGRSFTYLFTDFLQRLARRGMGEAEFDQMLRINPRRLLTGEQG